LPRILPLRRSGTFSFGETRTRPRQDRAAAAQPGRQQPAVLERPQPFTVKHRRPAEQLPATNRYRGLVEQPASSTEDGGWSE